jgi:hypothetical protein
MAAKNALNADSSFLLLVIKATGFPSPKSSTAITVIKVEAVLVRSVRAVETHDVPVTEV